MRPLSASIPLLALVLLQAPELPACGPFPPSDEPGFGGDAILALFSPWNVPDTLFAALIDDADGLAHPFADRAWEDRQVSLTHTEEWLAFLGWGAGAGPGAQLEEILDQGDPAAGFRKTILPMLPGQTPADLRAGAAAYLELMGEANRALNSEREAAWSYGSPSTKRPDWEGISRKAASAAGSAKDAFLRSRYAFQAVRAASLARAPDSALELHDAYFADPTDKGLLRYRALGYAARAWMQKGAPQTAFGHYIAIFDEYPALAGQVLLSLRVLDIPDEAFDRWTEALSTPHRRAVAAFAHALIDPHRDLTRYVEQILRWEPASPLAAKLLLGTVRSIEAERLPRLFAGLSAPGRQLQQGLGVALSDWREQPSFDDARILRLLGVVRQARAGGAVSYPGLWLAAEAHLLLLLGQAKAAAAVLEQVPALTALDPLEQGLLHLVATLAGWSAAGGGSWQPRLADDLRFLDLLAEKDRQDSRPWKSYLSLLAHQHLAAGDVARAVVAFSAAGSRYTAAVLLDSYGEPGDLAALESLLNEPATPEDRALRPLCTYTPQDVRYLRGVRLARRGEFRAALDAWDSLPPRFWERSGQGPTGDAPLLHVRVSFSNTLLDPSKGWQVMNRKQAVARLAELSDTLSSLRGRTGSADRRSAAEAAAALGSAFLSTPYLGYADLLWDGSMVETLRFLRNDRWPFLLRDVAAKAAAGYERFRREYDHLAVAARYFEQARALETDRERAARHALTAILCWDSYLYHGEFMENPSPEKGRKADQNRRDFARLYWTTAFYRTYARSFGDAGCPGIDSHR